MLALLVLDLVIVCGFILVGLVVILKDSHALLNRLFFGFVVTIAAWILSNYLSNDFTISHKAALIANHVTLFMPGLVLLFLLNFTLILSDRVTHRYRWISANSIALLIYFLSLTPVVFSSIQRQDSSYAIVFKPFGDVYFLTLLLNMIVVIILLARGRRLASGKQKARLNAILWAVSAMIAVNLATNALLPAIGNSFSFTNFGPLSAIFVVYALWYSVARHGLFDIRFVIARSLAYILSIGSLLILFILGSFALTNIVFRNSLTDRSSRLVYALISLVIALALPSLRQFFDRVSNQLFYRDAYDSQVFLDELNKILTSFFDLHPLLRKSADLINGNLKIEFCGFTISPTERTPARNYIIGNTNFDDDDLQVAAGTAYDFHARIINLEALDESQLYSWQPLRAKNVSVVVRLSAAATGSKTVVGYMVLGSKKSGNIYNKQDLQIIEIISNELVIAIQNSLRLEEIENFNATLQERVNQATRKLRHANDKLRALDETKDDFISMASHQLRTPLTSVKGYLSMVLEGDAGKLNKTQTEMLNQAYFSSQRMVFLIADLLNVSRLKTGKFTIEPSTVNLSDVVQQELEQLNEIAETHNISLQYDRPKDFPPLALDETKTRQVIMNFIDNAIYYTPSGGHIDVQLIDKQGSVELRVVDDGMGVPKHEQPHLFTKFYRAGNARQARPDGTGLGLFMAKKVIIAQGGALIFESKEGKGSTFGFSFSKAKLLVETPNTP